MRWEKPSGWSAGFGGAELGGRRPFDVDAWDGAVVVVAFDPALLLLLVCLEAAGRSLPKSSVVSCALVRDCRVDCLSRLAADDMAALLRCRPLWAPAAEPLLLLMLMMEGWLLLFVGWCLLWLFAVAAVVCCEGMVQHSCSCFGG